MNDKYGAQGFETDDNLAASSVSESLDDPPHDRAAGADTDVRVELTAFTKVGGPLSKEIRLDPSGRMVSDGSACKMWRGHASRWPVGFPHDFAAAIQDYEETQALALGTLKDGIADKVQVTTKAKLNGQAAPDVIARTADSIAYRPGAAAVVLIDVDTKGMPPTMAEQIEALGGFLPTLLGLKPELAEAARVVRASTSSWIFNSDTKQWMTQESGLHAFFLIKDGADAKRFLRRLHDWCWLNGFGWKTVNADGTLSERSLVDRMVYAAERIVFEGAPRVLEPLQQDKAKRVPLAFDGIAADTAAIVPNLSIAEAKKLRGMRVKEDIRLKDQAAAVRAAFIARKAAELAERDGVPLDDASVIIERQIAGILTPRVILEFDDEELAGCTVGDVLADPERFIGATLADPNEGAAYGFGKAMVMRSPTGGLVIHSFAHGERTYELAQDTTEAPAPDPERPHEPNPGIRLARATLRARLAKADGAVLPTHSNALMILGGDPALERLVEFNAFSGDLTLLRAAPTADSTIPPATGPYPRALEPHDVTLLLAFMQRTWANFFRRETVNDCVKATARRFERHDVRDYLNGLKWDGVKRLDKWLIMTFGCDDTAYHRAVGSKTLIAAVRRVRRPGCKFDTILVLEGFQRIGKSTAFKELASEPWFTDDLGDLNSKDAAVGLRGKWIIEAAEIDKLIRVDPETVKAFLSRSTDHYRPPYGERAMDVPRQSIMVGTTNSSEYLRDCTGNSRFWPVVCRSTPDNGADIRWLTEHRDQLWAEAAHREAEGETIWLDNAAIRSVAQEVQAARMASDSWDDKVAAYVTGSGVGSAGYTTVADIFDNALFIPNAQQTKALQMRVTDILKALCWVRDTEYDETLKKMVKRWRPPADE